MKNPMYVGLTVAYVGVSLVIASVWPHFALPLIVLAVNRLVIAREETYLRRRFGASYEDFSSRVRRWL